MDDDTLTVFIYHHRLRTASVWRAVTDQYGIQREERVRYRLRYSISVEQPLKGVTVEPKEYYLVFDNEYVGSFQDGTGHLEIRFASAIGYQMLKNDQIQTGLDYRARNLMEHNTRNSLWLNIGWRHSF